MAQKKIKKKTIQPPVNNQPKPIALRLDDCITREILDNDRCSCGGHIWSYMVDGKIIRKCGDCGYLF